MQNTKNRKGFTLVEIMIVVVIIGLLAAMAIPAFQQVRQNSIEKTMINDARQLASAAQQYMLENGVTVATITYTTTSGEITGPLQDYVARISTGYSAYPATIQQGTTFSMGHPNLEVATRTFTPEGQLEN